MYIEEELLKLADNEYGDFASKLAPNIKRSDIIGIRVPQLRSLAKRLEKDDIDTFLISLPHRYYDENLLHSILLCKEKDFAVSIKEVENFLPYIDNWAVCDTLRPISFKKNRDKLMAYIDKWLASSRTYTVRFAIDTLMSEYLDEDFKEEYLDKVARIRSDEYYINMMIAWYFATALAKQYSATIVYLQQKKLDDFCHNKTIQKAIESYRITKQQKDYLKTLRIVKR